MAVYIEKAMAVIQGFTGSVGFRHDDRALFALQNSFIHISLAYYRLRALREEALQACAIDSDEGYLCHARALEDNFLSMREIIFHINKFLYRLKLYRSGTRLELIREAAEKAVDDLAKLTVKLIR